MQTGFGQLGTDSKLLPVGYLGMCPKTRPGRSLLKGRGIPEYLIGVRLGGDFRVGSGDLPGRAEQEGDAVGIPPFAQHSQRL